MTPSWAKEPAPRGEMKSLLFQDSSPPVESQTSGTHCLIQHYSPFYPVCPKGNLIKSKSQNGIHLKILLQVRCLFVRCRLGRMVENQELWEDDGLTAPPLRSLLSVGATGDLGPVFAFLGIRRGGIVCS